MVKGSTSFLTFFGAAPNSFVSEKSAVKCTATELKKGKNPLPIQCVCHQQACWEIAIFLKTDYWHWWIILSLSRRTLDQEVLMEFTILWKLIAARIQVLKKRKWRFSNILLLCCCHKSKVFPSISCPYFPRWHPLANTVWHACANPQYLLPFSYCALLSVLCHIGSLHYFRVIPNWLRVGFFCRWMSHELTPRIDGTPKQRTAEQGFLPGN